MAKRRTKMHKDRAQRRAEREAGMLRAGGSSNYAKKKRWLHRHGGWGFEYPVKPWRAL